MTRSAHVLACSIVCLLSGGTLFAQPSDTERLSRAPNQAVYAEILGNGGLASVNLDRKLNSSFTVRIGYGVWQTFRSIPVGDQPNDYAVFRPVMLTFVRPFPTAAYYHAFEAGVGGVFGERWTEGGPHEPFRSVAASVGYRLVDRFMILRLAITRAFPIVGDHPGRPFRPAASFGLAF